VSRNTKKTLKVDSHVIALLSQAIHIISEGHNVPAIVAIHVPGQKPLIVCHGHPKDLIKLWGATEQNMEMKLEEITFVEIEQTGEDDE